MQWDADKFLQLTVVLCSHLLQRGTKLELLVSGGGRGEMSGGRGGEKMRKWGGREGDERRREDERRERERGR